METEGNAHTPIVRQFLYDDEGWVDATET